MVVLRVGPGPARVTDDGGRSWRDVTGLPNELVHDVWNWQVPLAGDGATPGVFYVADGGAVYKSVDSGASFVVAASGLPGTSQALVSVPHVAGELWRVAGGSGLAHSTDGGRTFRTLPGVREAALFAVGKSAPRSSSPTLYLYGTLSGGKSGIFRSVDRGTSWVEIDDPREPVGDDPNSMTASTRTFGLVFIGTNGRGIYYGRPQ